MENPKLQMLDLFSGIGGFSKAFDSIFDTIGYCEISEYCRKILESNMENGNLRKAPVCNDIRDVNRSTFMGQIPRVLTGGFPCQDISTCNVKSVGISGKRSGLFYEIIRIIHVFPEVQHVILENVPRLMSMGFETVKSSLTDIGFEVRHCIVSARQLGAHHNRKRLFIIASRSFSELFSSSKNLDHHFSWIDNQPEKLIKCTIPSIRKDIRDRCGACGNAIVPLCAVMAFRNMVFGSELPNERVDLNLVLSDGEQEFKKQVWGTPYACARRYYKYKALSKRSTTILYNQLFFEIGNEKDSSTYTINPQFVEWLMGYPLGYTKIN